MNIAVFSSKPYDEEYFEKHQEQISHTFTFFETKLDKDTAHLTEGFDGICVFVNDDVCASTMEVLASNGIRLIALRCAGYNNVDLKSAKEKNITVVRVPAYSPEAVAQHALALILTLSRKTHKAYNRVREGNFSLNNLIGFNINTKVVGVIGTGKIGATFCKTLSGFGCKILAYDVYESDELKQSGVQYVTLDKVFQEADIISLHCPLFPETKHMINTDSISKMKKDVMIINTSRGELIHTQDVIDALMHERIGYLGIDVYEFEEDLFFQDISESIIHDDHILRLNSFPNVLITPHQAYFTKEAMDEITTTTIENIHTFDRGETSENVVTIS